MYTKQIAFPGHGWFTILDKRGYLEFEREHTEAEHAAWMDDAGNESILIHQALLDKRWEAFGLWLTKE